jgi:hypothetical protein
MCSCGNPQDHVIAKSVTADGVMLERWSNGDITGRMGQYPTGIGKARSAKAAEAADKIWANISLYDWAELPALIKAARLDKC